MAKGSINCYLAAPRPTLGHYWKGSLTYSMLITVVLHIWPVGYRKSRYKDGSQSWPSASWSLNREPCDSEHNFLTH